MSPTGLPEGWTMDYDGKRWFYTYMATGSVQYKWPQPGDEFTDFIPALETIPFTLSPEDQLAIQQNQSKNPEKKKMGQKKMWASGMAATGGTMALYEDDEFCEEEGFRPEALMYMGPGGFRLGDISPVDEEGPGELDGGMTAGSMRGNGSGISLDISEKSTPEIGHVRMVGVELPAMPRAFELHSDFRVEAPATVAKVPVSEATPNHFSTVQFEVHMLDSREIQTSTVRRQESRSTGPIVEMPSEHILSPVEIAPIEMPDPGVLAPIEEEARRKRAKIPEGVVELPIVEVAFSVEEKEKREREKRERLREIRRKQKPYEAKQYPFQPKEEDEDKKEALPVVPPKIKHDGFETIGPRFRPFNPSVAPVSIASKATITVPPKPPKTPIPSSHFDKLPAIRPFSELHNPRLSLLSQPNKYHLQISASQPSLYPHDSLPIAESKQPPIIALQTNTPTLPIFDGPQQPPASLQPGVLAENEALALVKPLKLPPLAKTSPVPTLGPSTSSALPYPDGLLPPNSCLPYPSDDYSGNDVILDLQPVEPALGPKVRGHRSLSMRILPDPIVRNATVEPVAGDSFNICMQQQVGPPEHVLRHQQSSLIGGNMRHSMVPRPVVPRPPTGQIGRLATVQQPMPEAPGILGHSDHGLDCAAQDLHIQPFPGHIAALRSEIPKDRRHSSVVSALSSPQSAGGASIISVSTISSTLGSGSGSVSTNISDSRCPSNSVSRQILNDRQSGYFPLQDTVVSPVGTDFGSPIGSSGTLGQTGSLRAKVTAKEGRGQTDLHPINEMPQVQASAHIPPERQPEQSPVLPKIERRQYSFETPEDIVTPVHRSVSPKLSGSKSTIIMSQTTQKQSTTSFLMTPATVPAKSRPTSLPPLPRAATPQLQSKPQPMSPAAPIKTLPPSKERSKWLSKLFKYPKAHKKNNSLSFTVLNAGTTSADTPVAFPVGWEERPAAPAPVHQDGLRSHPPAAVPAPMPVPAPVEEYAPEITHTPSLSISSVSSIPPSPLSQAVSRNTSNRSAISLIPTPLEEGRSKRSEMPGGLGVPADDEAGAMSVSTMDIEEARVQIFSVVGNAVLEMEGSIPTVPASSSNTMTAEEAPEDDVRNSSPKPVDPTKNSSAMVQPLTLRKKPAPLVGKLVPSALITNVPVASRPNTAIYNPVTPSYRWVVSTSDELADELLCTLSSSSNDTSLAAELSAEPVLSLGSSGGDYYVAATKPLGVKVKIEEEVDREPRTDGLGMRPLSVGGDGGDGEGEKVGLARGKSRAKWARTPAPDYSGDGWDKEEWA